MVQEVYSVGSFLVTASGLILIATGTVFMAMPDLSYTYLRRLVYFCSPKGRALRRAEMILFEDIQSMERSISRQDHPDVVDALYNLYSVPDEYNLDEPEDCEEIRIEDDVVRIVMESGWIYFGYKGDNPVINLQRSIKEGLEDHFQRLAIPLVIIGTIVSIVGAIPLVIFNTA